MSTEPSASADIFQHVSTGRVSEVIVDQVRQLIRSGRLRAGDRLPSERELGELFGVSRVTVREALRILEASGLITVRVGSHGGSFVSRPTSERLGRGLADLVSLSPLTSSDVTEARFVIELGILPMVVARATGPDIADLHRMVDDAETAQRQDAYNMAMSAAFHVRVARCTHNPGIEMLVHTFREPMLMSLREAKTVAPLMGPQGTCEHRALVHAIERHDLFDANQIMRAHLDRTSERLRSLAR